MHKTVYHDFSLLVSSLIAEETEIEHWKFYFGVLKNVLTCLSDDYIRFRETLQYQDNDWTWVFSSN